MKYSRCLQSPPLDPYLKTLKKPTGLAFSFKTQNEGLAGLRKQLDLAYQQEAQLWLQNELLQEQLFLCKGHAQQLEQELQFKRQARCSCRPEQELLEQLVKQLKEQQQSLRRTEIQIQRVVLEVSHQRLVREGLGRAEQGVQTEGPSSRVEQMRKAVDSAMQQRLKDKVLKLEVRCFMLGRRQQNQ